MNKKVEPTAKPVRTKSKLSAQPVINDVGSAEVPSTNGESVGREKVARRLARIAGHASSLQRLWAEGYECKEMLTQIAAVRAALDQVGKVVLEHHIEHCVSEAIERGHAEEAVRDLKGALDRFVK